MSDSPKPALHGKLAGQALQTFARLGALIAVYAFFAILTPATRGFATGENTLLMLQDITVVAMAAIGATIVIISGGIDLSAGSVVALSMISTAFILNLGPAEGPKLITQHPVALPLGALAAAMLVGTLVGLLNGAMITFLRIVPFIITLGTMQIARGLSKQVAQQQNIYPPATVQEMWIGKMNSPTGAGRLPEGLAGHFHAILHMPPAVWAVVAAAILASLFLRHTRLGRHIFAIGSNEKTANLCGVPVQRTKILVYVIAGLFSGLAGVIFFSRLGATGQPTEGIGYELFFIAAAVIGGASLLGGRGTIFGTMIGALIITILRNGGVKMGWPQYTQEIVMGAVIIVAVAIDNLRNRKRA
jgi:erythritol transport system permease protein